MASRTAEILSESCPNLDSYYELYRHFHANPELSFQEEKTAAKIAEQMKQWDFKVYEKIGGHGLVAVLENGPGKTVLLRADMDALPVEEKTDFPYASKIRMIDSDGREKPVMHACGHDVHITTLIAAAETLYNSRAKWSGTLICLFQPAEERGSGAIAMIKDDVYGKIGHIPDIVLGAHVTPYPAGFIGIRPGVITSNCDSYEITLFGRGGHGSTPEATIDPVLLGSHVVVRLQGIVSREIAPLDMAVFTVGSIVSGETDNVISDRAIIKVNMRSVKKEVRAKMIASMKRIVEAECMASGSPQPPLFNESLSVPLTPNDDDCTKLLSESFAETFGANFKPDVDLIAGSEDFSVLATEIGKPCCFWLYGSINPAKFYTAMKNDTLKDTIPMNHSALFAPEIESTLKSAVESYVVAALTWL